MPPLLIRSLSAVASSPTPVLITVAGDIDVVSAPQLRRHLQPIRDHDVVLDISRVSLLAAAGLHVLVDLKQRLDETGAQLILAAPTAVTRRTLTVAYLHDTVATSTSVTEAIRTINCHARQ